MKRKIFNELNFTIVRFNISLKAIASPRLSARLDLLGLNNQKVDINFFTVSGEKIEHNASDILNQRAIAAVRNH